MTPKIYVGPNGGKYVLSLNNEKLYVPNTVTKWSKDSKTQRWRIYLANGTTMLYPTLK